MQLKVLLPLALGALVTAAPATAPTPTALLPRYHSFDSTKENYNYTTVPGFFLQDDNATVPGTFDYVCNLQISNKESTDDCHSHYTTLA